MIGKTLPKTIKHVLIPPVKCQGIKTKLVSFIAKNVAWQGKGRWIEPFFGSGVVAFNVAPDRALLSDSNKHIVDIYLGIMAGNITEDIVRGRLHEMGDLLKERGESYFYEVRERFNSDGDPMDLLFLNRSCFNGIMRFNKKGRYNVPFGKKTERFRQSYITKICNQIRWVRLLLLDRRYEIRAQDWRETLSEAQPDDFVYLDPPYFGRHTDYFNQWTEDDAEGLAIACKLLPCGYALSMWKSNKYRENEHLDRCWNDGIMRTITHFYHVGPTESLRNEMTEALVVRQGFAANVDDVTPNLPVQNVEHIQQLLYGSLD